MPIKKIVASFLFVFTVFACQEKPEQLTIPKIIPIPSSLMINEGHFFLNSSVGIDYPENLWFQVNF